MHEHPEVVGRGGDILVAPLSRVTPTDIFETLHYHALCVVSNRDCDDDTHKYACMQYHTRKRVAALWICVYSSI